MAPFGGSSRYIELLRNRALILANSPLVFRRRTQGLSLPHSIAVQTSHHTALPTLDEASVSTISPSLTPTFHSFDESTDAQSKETFSHSTPIKTASAAIPGPEDVSLSVISPIFSPSVRSADDVQEGQSLDVGYFPGPEPSMIHDKPAINIPDHSYGFNTGRLQDLDGVSYETSASESQQKDTQSTNLGEDNWRLPIVNPFMFNNFERRYFQYACAIIQTSVMNAATPAHVFDLPYVKPLRHLRIYQALALMLSVKSSGEDVAAVTCDNNLFSDPPALTMFWSKNKVPTQIELERADQLCELVRTYTSCDGRRDFFAEAFEFILLNQKPKWLKYARTLLEETHRVCELLSSIEKALPAQRDEIDQETDEELNGDAHFRRVAANETIKPHEAIILCVEAISLLSAKMTRDPPTNNDLKKLSAMGYTLSVSKLYRNLRAFCSRNRREFDDFSSLFDTTTTVGAYFGGLDILAQYCEREPYKSQLHRIQSFPVAELNNDQIQTVANRYGLHVQDPVEPDLEEAIDDFYDVISLFQEKLRREGSDLKTGGPKDWLRRYPRLADLKFNSLPQPQLHAEVKVGLSALLHGTSKAVNIGTSKNPCFCCKSFFEAMNLFVKEKKFMVSTSHEKVYPGWKGSGLEELDGHVVVGVWDALQKVMKEVQYIDEKDIRLLTFLTPAGEEAINIGEFEEFREVLERFRQSHQQ